MPCLKHVQIDADVRFVKPLSVKRRFSAGLKSDKYDCFHPQTLPHQN